MLKALLAYFLIHFVAAPTFPLSAVRVGMTLDQVEEHFGPSFGLTITVTGNGSSALATCVYECGLIVDYSGWKVSEIGFSEKLGNAFFSKKERSPAR